MNNMEEKPVVLVIGNEEYKAEELIKYIRLCAMNSKRTSVESFANHVEGIIIFEDQVTENNLPLLNEWSHVIDTYDLAVRLYVCREANPNRRDNVEQWCIKHQFELVEIDISTDKKNLALEFNENIGIDRVIEVLQAHRWPSMTLKKQRSCTTPKLLDLSPVSLTDECRTESDSWHKYSSTNAEIDESGDNDFEKLSVLFQNLQSVKDKISSLSREEKLREAEMAVKAFWCAINGNADEISDDEDDSAKNFTE